MFYCSFPPDPATPKPELKITTLDYVSLRLQKIARLSGLFVTCSGADLHYFHADPDLAFQVDADRSCLLHGIVHPDQVESGTFRLVWIRIRDEIRSF